MSFASRRRQRCSHCQKTGHNKRVCPQIVDRQQSSHLTVVSSTLLFKRSQKKKKQRGKHVDVFVSEQHQPSHHIVNLRTDQREEQWQEVPVYELSPSSSQRSSSTRQVFDIAKAVQEYNTVADVNEYLSFTAQQKKKQHTPWFRRMWLRVCSFLFAPFHHIARLMSRVGSVRRKSKPPVFLQPSFSSSRTRDISWKYIIKFVAVCITIVALPFPVFTVYRTVSKTGTEIVEASTNAFLSLQSSTVAAFHANLPQAQYDLTEALSSFEAASSLLDKEHKLLVSTVKFLPIIGSHVRSRQSVLVAGHEIALGNTYLIKGIEEASKDPDASLIDRFRILRVHIDRSIPQYEQALRKLDTVDIQALPVDYQEQFSEFRTLFRTVIGDMRDVVELIDAIDLVFGGTQPRTHLLMFQNNREWRPTGGFTGSFAVIKFLHGAWTIEVPGGGTYDIQGQLDRYITPPLPLQLVNKRWEFQDANWFPDFAASAKKTIWFYEQARRETVDGVISIDATVLERFLRVVGPALRLSYDDISFDPEDVISSLEQHIQSEQETTAPKQILSTVLEQFLQDVREIDTNDALLLLQQLHEALENNEIKVYFSDESEERFREFGWTGELVETAPSQDYLHVSVANIGGAKTDAFVDQRIEHQSVIDEDGSIINTVIVHRNQRKSTDDNPLYNTSNISYVRLYVPKGAVFLDAGGFTYPPEHLFTVPEDWYEKDADIAAIDNTLTIDPKTGTYITEEFGKTVFGNWIITSPGESQSLYMVYRLPFSVRDTQVEDGATDSPRSVLADWFSPDAFVSRYSIFVQKQSGKDVPFSSQVLYPAGWKSVWKSRDDVSLASNGASFDTVLEKDTVYGVVFEQP